jgi:hypothetical protein
MGIWRLEGMRGNTDHGVCPVCGREEGGSHMLLCEGTRNWGDKWLERRFTRIYPDVGIKRIASNKTKDIWPKIDLYLIRYEGKCESAIKRIGERDEEKERYDETENEIENYEM